LKNKKIAIDLDGTICEEKQTFEKFLAKPIKNAIETINKLYEDNFIIIFTARGWQEYNITKAWLEQHKVNHHLLICGKPIYDVIVDDRAITAKNNWDEISKKLLNGEQSG